MHNSVTEELALPLSGELHPQVAEHLKALQKAQLPPIETLPVPALRAGFAVQMKNHGTRPAKLHEVRPLSIPRPGGEIPARLYRPAAGTLPVLLFMHGGGWVIGNLDTHDDLCRDLAAQSGCAVLAVDYRLAPEHPYPAAIDDTLTALVWTHAHAADLGLDPQRIAVGGDSAGGNLAAVVALDARSQGGPHLAGQLLIYPVTDLTRFDTPSYKACAQGYGLTASGVVWLCRQYVPEARAAGSRVSPAHALDLRALPPALVITAEYDVLRSEGETYAARLDAAGVPTRLSRYDGMIHGFVSMAGIFDVGATARAEAADWLRETLQS